MKNVIWFVESGPTPSHLADVRVFDRLKDAREHIANLPDMPTGGDRPFRLTRREHTSDTLVETNI